MDMKKMTHVDTNYGVDFEIAKERLSAKAGLLFRQYRACKADPSQTPAKIEQARLAYLEAQATYKNRQP
jgi:multidrug resistance efflux pump